MNLILSRNVFIVLCSFLLFGCAGSTEKGARTSTDYAGRDAGKVVVGLGIESASPFSGVSLKFRRRDGSKVPFLLGKDQTDARRYSEGNLIFLKNNLFFTEAPDYQSSEESGVVTVASIPPGEYEVWAMDAFIGNGVFVSQLPTPIPFTVRVAGTTYLGNFETRAIWGENRLGMKIASAPYMVLTDRQATDMGIAIKLGRVQSTSALVNAFIDPRKLGAPFILPSRIQQ